MIPVFAFCAPFTCPPNLRPTRACAPRCALSTLASLPRSHCSPARVVVRGRGASSGSCRRGSRCRSSKSGPVAWPTGQDSCHGPVGGLDLGREETVEWRKLGLKPIIPSSYRSRRNVNRRIREIRVMPGIASRCLASGVSGSHDMNPSSAPSLGRTDANP